MSHLCRHGEAPAQQPPPAPAVRPAADGPAHGVEGRREEDGGARAVEGLVLGGGSFWYKMSRLGFWEFGWNSPCEGFHLDAVRINDKQFSVFWGERMSVETHPQGFFAHDHNRHIYEYLMKGFVPGLNSSVDLISSYFKVLNLWFISAEKQWLFAVFARMGKSVKRHPRSLVVGGSWFLHHMVLDRWLFCM